MKIRALILRQDGEAVSANIDTIEDDMLPEGDVTIDVEYSSINYKDGMVINGVGRLVKTYPHIPGIDFSGRVRSSADDRFKPGDQVILTGWRVGEISWGGLAQAARVKGDWLVHLPEGLDAEQAMGVGTAGLTAMLCVMALEEHNIRPENGPVIVTGAAGGVGGVAIALLAALGYHVVASTGRDSARTYLMDLGAAEVIDRRTLSEPLRKPLLSETYAGGVDTVGSHTLANVLAQIKYGGSVAACGIAQGADLPAMVTPFILRAVNLLGIDSVMCPRDRRERGWKRVAEGLPKAALQSMMETHPLSAAPELAKRVLEGAVRGRAVIDVNA